MAGADVSSLLRCDPMWSDAVISDTVVFSRDPTEGSLFVVLELGARHKQTGDKWTELQ